MRRSGFSGAWDKSDQVACQFGEGCQDLAGRRHGDEQPAWQGAFQVREGIGSVEFVIIRRVVERCGFDDGEGMEVVGQDFGAKILLRSQPGQAGGVFQRHAMLEPFERLFDAPTAVVQVCEAGCGIRRGIHQRGNDHVDTPVWSHHTDQAHLGGRRCTFVIDAVRRIGRTQRDDGFRLAGVEEGLDRGKAGGIGTDAEMNAELRQKCDQPARWVTAIQDQQVVWSQANQMLEQHLTLIKRRFIKLGSKRHLQARKVEGEGDGLANAATGGVLEKQLHLGCIGRHDAQSVPERHVHASLDEVQQSRVEGIKDAVGELLPSLREGLSTDLANQISLVRQRRIERIEFILDAGLEAGQHRHHQNGKGQNPFTNECSGIETIFSAQFA